MVAMDCQRLNVEKVRFLLYHVTDNHVLCSVIQVPILTILESFQSNMVTELNLSETCTISYSSPFPFLIQFDDSSVGCVPCGQKLFFNCSKVRLFCLPMLVQCSFQLLVGKDLVL